MEAGRSIVNRVLPYTIWRNRKGFQVEQWNDRRIIPHHGTFVGRVDASDR